MTTLATPHQDRRGFGIGIVLAAQLFFATLDSSVKWLTVSGMPTFEITFVRYGVQLVLLLVLFLPVSGMALLRTGNWKLELLRGFCLLGVTLGNFIAMQYLPLTVTGAILFTMPLIVTVLSVPILGETVGWRRGLAVLAGFIGVLIIVRPGTDAFHPATLLCVGGAICAALFAIVTRLLSKTDSAATQQVYSGLIALVVITPFAFDGWVWPQDGPTWFAFIAAGIAGMLAHQLNAIAIRYAPPSVLAPFSYTELLLLAFASWLIFKEPPDIWFFVGAPLIILSGLYIWLRERALHKATTLKAVED
jgi:drug/metabolite transporter (DMT)-like permease